MPPSDSTTFWKRHARMVRAAIGCVYVLGIVGLGYLIACALYVDVDVFGVFREEAEPTFASLPPPDPTVVASVSAGPSIFHSSKLPKIASARKQDLFDSCKLVDHEPWDEELRSLLNPSFDPLRTCNRSFSRLTQLIEGVLDQTFGAMLTGGYACEGRCLYPKTDYAYSASEWESLPIVVDCDVAETRCTRNGSDEYIYHYLHTQIAAMMRNSSSPPPRRAPFKPSVYIVLFDSVADTQSMRSFPTTIEYLQRRFNATRFRHLNKVGDNSRPNGYAFLLGDVAYGINKEIFGVPSLKSRWGYERSCKTPLDLEDDFVFTRFRRRGYRTMIAEDWAEGVFNYPSCIGFNNKPVDHYMRPFQLRLDEKAAPTLLKTAMGIKSCREPHLDLMEYMDKFIRAYPDDPKFGFIWMSYLTHDNPNMIFHADKDVRAFFERNEEEFEYSFVFFMGDHGLRFGKQRESRLGRLEVNNPMLHVIVPKQLRGRLGKTLEDNSRQLLTMFDLHATFVDIAEYQPKSNFTAHSFTPIPSPTPGSSFLRELDPKLPRNCRTLPIPFDYCPCDFDKETVGNSSTADAMATFVVRLMNEELDTFGLLDHCAELRVEGKPIAEAFAPVEETNLYRVEFTASPGGGRFESLIRSSSPSDPSSFSLVSPSFNRLNAYGRAAECISRAPQKPYCYCKKFLKHKG